MKEIDQTPGNLDEGDVNMENANFESGPAANNVGAFKNPHNICTLNENSACAGCGISGKLACKWDKDILSGFYAISFPAVLMAYLGIIFSCFVTGVWWPLVAYVIYFFSMFGVFEIRFLCSHCPYYAESGNILHCLANHGSFKFWRYHPEPMNKFEQLMMYVLLATIFFIFPVAITGYGLWTIATQYASFGLLPLLGLAGLTIASLTTSASFVSSVKRFYCTQCVNFSCPLNTVPKPVVDAYLKRNPVMREAWEASGYTLD